MSNVKSLRCYNMLQREFQESRVSLLITPVVIALVMSLLLLGSVLIAKRITVMGDAFLEMVMMEEFDIEPVITINFDDDEVSVPSPPDAPAVFEPPASTEGAIAESGQDASEDQWDFGREWRFEPTDAPEQHRCRRYCGCDGQCDEIAVAPKSSRENSCRCNGTRNSHDLICEFSIFGNIKEKI